MFSSSVAIGHGFGKTLQLRLQLRNPLRLPLNPLRLRCKLLLHLKHQLPQIVVIHVL